MTNRCTTSRWRVALGLALMCSAGLAGEQSDGSSARKGLVYQALFRAALHYEREYCAHLSTGKRVNVPEAFYYLGVCQLESGYLEDALDSLGTLQRRQSTAALYVALSRTRSVVCEARLGKRSKDAAIKEVRGLARSYTGPNRERALAEALFALTDLEAPLGPRDSVAALLGQTAGTYCARHALAWDTFVRTGRGDKLLGIGEIEPDLTVTFKHPLIGGGTQRGSVRFYDPTVLRHLGIAYCREALSQDREQTGRRAKDALDLARAAQALGETKSAESVLVSLQKELDTKMAQCKESLAKASGRERAWHALRLRWLRAQWFRAALMRPGRSLEGLQREAEAEADPLTKALLLSSLGSALAEAGRDGLSLCQTARKLVETAEVAARYETTVDRLPSVPALRPIYRALAHSCRAAGRHEEELTWLRQTYDDSKPGTIDDRETGHNAQFLIRLGLALTRSGDFSSALGMAYVPLMQRYPEAIQIWDAVAYLLFVRTAPK